MSSIEEKNKPKNKRQAFMRLVDFLKPYKWRLALGIGANFGIALVVVLPGLIVRQLTDNVILAQGALGPRYRLMILCILGLLGVHVVSAALSWVRAYVMHVLGEQVILDIRKKLYAHLQSLSVSFFDSRQTGEIMSRVTNDSEVVEEFVNHVADTLICDSITLVYICAVMFLVSPKLAMIAVFTIPVLFLLARRFSMRVRPIYRAVRERLAEINAKMQENLSGIRVIKAFAREDYEFGNFRTDVEAYYDRRVSAIRMWSKFFPSIGLLVTLGTVAVWTVGALDVMAGVTTMGTLVMFTMYMGIYTGPVRSLAQINDTIQRSLAAAERIFEILDEEPQIQDADKAVELPRVQGRVEFDHVNFSYGTEEEVLSDICIKAEPGQIVALVGRSGAGKTSIVNLIPRFYDPREGRILIDGFDVRFVKQQSLRSQIAMVLQDTFLFNGTVKDNIRYGRLEASDQEIIEAAKAANAAEFIDEMPAGYETEIGERGIKLSGGQKQRLAIARAILADPRILILDEATSSVDSESEYLIHRAMDRLMEGRTTFVIAHRLSTVKHADQIITLEKGQVSEVGDHKTLVDNEGVYSQMYAAQFRLDEEIG